MAGLRLFIKIITYQGFEAIERGLGVVSVSFDEQVNARPGAEGEDVEHTFAVCSAAGGAEADIRRELPGSLSKPSCGAEMKPGSMKQRHYPLQGHTINTNDLGEGRRVYTWARRSSASSRSSISSLWSFARLRKLQKS